MFLLLLLHTVLATSVMANQQSKTLAGSTSATTDSVNPGPGPSSANSNVPQQASFEFIKNPPGQLYSIGSHRLHASCRGEGEVVVLFEPGLGGSSLEWIPLQEAIAVHTRACIYDRAGYAWSDPGNPPRNVSRLAAEAHLLLTSMEIEAPLILVGHSFGGMVARTLAELRHDTIKGLILVDASHEDQFEKFAGSSATDMLPKSTNFVISQPEIPAGLRDDIREKIYAFSRMRKTYAALHGELSSFRESAQHIKSRRRIFNFPVTVIQRGIDPYSDDDGGNRNRMWQELQQDLVGLSEQGELLVAEQSGHHIHIDQPQLVIDAILSMLGSQH